MNVESGRLPQGPLPGPVRVVLFCGPVLERGMVRFARLLDAHPEVDLVAGFCHSKGLGTGARLRDLFRRRGVIAVALLSVEIASAALRWMTRPGEERRHRRDEAWMRRWLDVIPNIHAPEVLEQIRAHSPDLGLIYGGPILKPQLFTIPRFGTLGIHHGRMPEYRGKKTTFWALYNGEATAGVTIQKVNEGIDTGQVVRAAELPARGRAYWTVERELEELGLDLYLDAVVSVRRGTARASAIEGEKGPLYRDPKPADLLRFVRRRWLGGDWTPNARATRRGPVGPAVLLLTESYHPMTGGGENQARALVGSLVGSGLDVGVVTRRWDPQQPAVGWVDHSPVWRVGPSGGGHLKKWGLALTALRPLTSLRRSRPALLVNGFRVLGIPAVLAARAFGLRVLLKGDSPGEMSGAFFDPGLRRFGLSHRSWPVRLALAARNWLLRRADAFVAISSALEEELVRHGVERTRILRIPNGVDVSVFRPAENSERQELREALGLDEARTLVLYTGRLVTYKGLPLLLEAWRRLAPRHPHAQLVLVGGGSADIHNCEDMLHRYVREHDLADRVLLPGEVSDVSGYLRSADLFVFPSQEEAFGLSVVEAMACGLPIVSTRTGGLADFVNEENGALPVPAGDVDALAGGLDQLLSDPARASELARRGPRAVRAHFSLDAVRDRYRSWIAATADSATAPRPETLA